jgi:signal transduction histidine kinase/ligand-binding sensor domain-containing protein
LLSIYFLATLRMAAVDPHTLISQYGHTAWRLQDGFIGDAGSITQTTDGYVWIVAGKSVFRFDGVKFRQWTPPNNQSLPTNLVNKVRGTRDGSLWIGTSGGLARWKDGRLTNYTKAPHSPGIYAILEDHNGKVWVTRYRINDGMGSLCWVKESTLECYGEKDGNPAKYARQVTEDSTGDIWFASTMLYHWHPPSLTTYFREQVNDSTGNGVTGVIAAPSGEILASLDGTGPKSGIQHFSDGKWSSFIVPGFDGRTVREPVLFVDRGKTLWIGTHTNGIYHFHDGWADHYGSADGLSSDHVQSLFEDREGNLWVGTDGGVDLFRDNAVINFSLTQGLVGPHVEALVAVNGDGVWVANDGGMNVIPGGPFRSIRRQKVPGQDVASMFVDSKGQVWLSVDSKLFAYKNGHYIEVRKADGSALGQIGYAEGFAEDPEGNLWGLTHSDRGGAPGYTDLLLIRDERVKQDFKLEPHTLYVAGDRRAGIWTLSLYGLLTHYIDGRAQESMQLGEARSAKSLDVDSQNAVWAGTNKGLYRWGDAKLTLMDTKNGLPCSRIYSSIQDDHGSHWLRTECGILRISADDWERWIRFPESKISVAVFDALDGVRSGVPQEGQPLATMSGDGRLWFATETSVQMVDPSRPTNLLLPPVHIEEVVADHKTYESLDKIAVPHLRGELEIDYTALSYKIPQKVLFRYKLEGHDTEWNEVGTRRQAFYNNLPPGKYRFHVIACNNDGVWNEAGESLDFSVLPAYYQTTWFRALCGAAVLLLLWLLYQYRVRQLQHQFNIGLEAQVSERMRIARELHDTLLQSFHGLLLRFQAASNLLPARPDDAKKRLDVAIDQGSHAIAEGRDAVQGLRSPTQTTNDLAMTLRILGDELVAGETGTEPPVIDVSVEGQPRSLRPIVRDEAFRISAEALRNAFRHAQAKRIETEIRYGADEFRVRVRDDGRGMDVGAPSGITGHFGLPGMRERAKGIGANLEVWSNRDSGTEVQLTVPHSVAYETPEDQTRFRVFRRDKWNSS